MKHCSRDLPLLRWISEFLDAIFCALYFIFRFKRISQWCLFLAKIFVLQERFVIAERRWRGYQERKLKQNTRDGIVVCNTYNFLSSPILFQYLKYFNVPKCITGFLWAQLITKLVRQLVPDITCMVNARTYQLLPDSSSSHFWKWLKTLWYCMLSTIRLFAYYSFCQRWLLKHRLI